MSRKRETETKKEETKKKKPDKEPKTETEESDLGEDADDDDDDEDGGGELVWIQHLEEMHVHSTKRNIPHDTQRNENNMVNAVRSDC